LPKWFGRNFFQKNRPKFTLISSRFGLLFDLKFSNFDKTFILGLSSYLLRLHFGQYLNKIGHIFQSNVWSHSFCKITRYLLFHQIS
jgi:hypothetical protein